MSKIMQRFYEVNRDATETSAKWTNTEVAQFHYFNPNGLYAQKKVLDDRVSEAVDAGKCKSGCLFVHGSLNNFSVDWLCKYASSKRVGWITLSTTLDMMRRDIRATEEFLANL